MKEMLLSVFGIELKREYFMFSWTMKELSTFTYDELRELHRTCTFFSKSDKKLASILKGRIGAECFNRSRALTKLPPLRITKSKGKKKDERIRRARDKARHDNRATKEQAGV